MHATRRTGQPESSPESYARFLPRIRQSCDAIVNITTGGGLGMTLDERLAAAKWARPEIASMNMGSFNFNISGAGERIKDFKHDWEKPYLDRTRDFILSNTFVQIEHAMNELGDLGTRFEFECYDTGHLYNLAHFAERGLVKPPFFVQCVFGVLGGIAAEPENLMSMRATADRLFGNDYYLSVLAAGRHQMPLVTMSAILGGNVRVGLEDSLYLGRGQLAKSNAEQVTKIRRILAELSLETATPTKRARSCRPRAVRMSDSEGGALKDLRRPAAIRRLRIDPPPAQRITSWFDEGTAALGRGRNASRGSSAARML